MDFNKQDKSKPNLQNEIHFKLNDSSLQNLKWILIKIGNVDFSSKDINIWLSEEYISLNIML